MTEKTVRPQQRSLRFSIAEPVVCNRIDIQIELERAAADDRNPAGWIGHIQWRLGDSSSEDLVERRCPSLLDLCRPQRVSTDNGSVGRRRKGADGDGRR